MGGRLAASVVGHLPDLQSLVKIPSGGLDVTQVEIVQRQVEQSPGAEARIAGPLGQRQALLTVGEGENVVAVQVGGDARQADQAMDLTLQVVQRPIDGEGLLKITRGLGGVHRVDTVPAELAEDGGLTVPIPQPSIDLQRCAGVLVRRFVPPLDAVPLAPQVEGLGQPTVVVQGPSQMQHLLQVPPLPLPVADPAQHLGPIAQDVAAERAVLGMGQQVQEATVAVEGRVVGEDPPGPFGGAEQVMDGRSTLTGGGEVVGQGLVPVGEDDLHCLGDPVVEPLPLREGHAVVHDLPHPVVAEPVPGFRLHEEPHPQQFVAGHQVEIGV